MIKIEICYTDNLKEQDFDLVKTILNLQDAKAIHDSDIWIKIKPQYIAQLIKQNIIIRNDNNKNFVQLTKAGSNINIINDHIELTLEEYFNNEKKLKQLILKSFNASIKMISCKITYHSCFCCERITSKLFNIRDNKNNTGIYCSTCLKRHGYTNVVKLVNDKRKRTVNAK